MPLQLPLKNEFRFRLGRASSPTSALLETQVLVYLALFDIEVEIGDELRDRAEDFDLDDRVVFALFEGLERAVRGFTF